MGETKEIMEETAKERIKRKKKERAEELSKEQATKPESHVTEPTEVTTVETQEPQATRYNKYGVSVLEIYPLSTPKPKYVVQGSLKLKIQAFGLEVRDVSYSIDKKHKVKVQPPFRYHRFPDEPEKPDAYIESIKFKNGNIWLGVVEIVKSAVLERHREELPEIEESQEKQSPQAPCIQR